MNVFEGDVQETLARVLKAESEEEKTSDLPKYALVVLDLHLALKKERSRRGNPKEKEKMELKPIASKSQKRTRTKKAVKSKRTKK